MSENNEPLLTPLQKEYLAANPEATLADEIGTFGPSRQSGKSSLLQVILGWLLIAVCIGAVVAYFGIRLTNGIEITAPLESSLGLQQRAAAASKVIRYDEAMNTRVRRGGMFKSVLFWPIKPSEAEIKGAREFVTVTLEGHSYLMRQRDFCGYALSDGYDELTHRLSPLQLKLVTAVAKHVQQKDILWKFPPALTLLDAIKVGLPCK
jgi:hypothetical protein